MGGADHDERVTTRAHRYRAPAMNPPDLPPVWHAVLTTLSFALDARHHWRLPVFVVGLLFARPRRTVAACLRAAGITDDHQPFYQFLRARGDRATALGTLLIGHVIPRVFPDGPVRFALDDTPTKRYGPCVQGAGFHHNPTPGPAGSAYLFGHVWVTLAAIPRHPIWGVLALPLRAALYIRRKDIPHLPPRHDRPFETKRQLAAALITVLRAIPGLVDRVIQVVVDGAYAARPVLRAAQAAGVTLVGRLRKDAALCSVPVPTPGRRGRPRLYGPDRLSLAKRASHPRGWETVSCFQYGRVRAKRVKTFLATWGPAGGLIRVVIVSEPTGWRAYFCTDPNLGAAEVLEIAAARTGIEDGFKDVKEEGGAGQQQVRDVAGNEGAFHLACWVKTLVELWAWARPAAELVNRPGWDDPARRPSFAEKRTALRAECLRREFLACPGHTGTSPEIAAFVERLIAQAA